MSSSRGLRIYNSLSRSVLPFKAVNTSKKCVSWYICGPTVYDHSHLGHARTYVTFDIIRRIMERYLNYQVLYVMNVTDVDDKIINKTKKEAVLMDFKDTLQTKELEDVLKEFQTIFDDSRNKLLSEKETISAKIASFEENGNKRKLVSLTEHLNVLEFKLANHASVLEKFASLPQEDPLKLLEVSHDIIGDHLLENYQVPISTESVSKTARKYESSFFEDMDNLNVIRPDVVTRVSEYMDSIVDCIKGIIENEFAYVLDGSVYFDTRHFNETEPQRYSKLARIKVDQNVSLEKVEGKKSPDDFALWKKAKADEPFWNSPWGPGRPGWHIECTAMASDIFGNKIDIHAGGEDLKFPHHDNEIAQAEAFHSCSSWVDTFMHSGQLSIQNHKMSKSLKNFITIREALDRFSASEIRLFFLLHPWNKPINYSEKSMAEAVAKVKQLKEYFLRVDSMKRSVTTKSKRWSEKDQNLFQDLSNFQNKIHECMLDNFDYSQVMHTISEMIQKMNLYENESPNMSLIAKYSEFIESIVRVVGLDDVCVSTVADNNNQEQFHKSLDALCDFRFKIRKLGIQTKNQEILRECDRLRGDLQEIGVRLEDTKTSSIWKILS